jgi:flagellar protein FliS
MAVEQNPYQAYSDGSVFSDNPLNLVIALYQGAMDATRQGQHALESGDIMGRSKAINKAISILTELLVSLDHEKGGEISQNLKKLYSYMQVQLLTAHAHQSPEPMAEVWSLLSTMLEGWRQAVQTPLPAAAALPALPEPTARQVSVSSSLPSAAVYGGYVEESAMGREQSAYSF